MARVLAIDTDDDIVVKYCQAIRIACFFNMSLLERGGACRAACPPEPVRRRGRGLSESEVPGLH